MSRLTISRAALDLIESFEGFRARAAILKNGSYTIGFGHSATARAGMQITREQAEELLRWDLRPIEDLVRQSCHAPITQNQFDALVSFAFNIGAEHFAQSEVLRHINQGEPVAAAVAMNAWRRANVNGKIIIVDALVRRRAAEVNLFFETAGARPAAPTSVIVPKLDYSAALLAPNPNAIKGIEPNKTDGEFVVKADEASETSDEAKGPTASAEPEFVTPSEPQKVPTSAELQGVPKEQVDAILDAKLGEGLLPFPDETLEEKAASKANVANTIETPMKDAANDGANSSLVNEKSRAKPHDVFRGQGIELKEIAKEPINWLGIMPWVIAGLGALAMLYGLNQIGILQVLGSIGLGKSGEIAPAIDANGFRAILITICGFAAVLLSALSAFDKVKHQ